MRQFKFSGTKLIRNMQGYISMYLSIKCNQISFGPESLLKKDVWLLVSMLAPRILHFYMLRIILYSF